MAKRKSLDDRVAAILGRSGGGGVYDPHLGYRVDEAGAPAGPDRAEVWSLVRSALPDPELRQALMRVDGLSGSDVERLVDARRVAAAESAAQERPWDDARRAALLAAIRKGIKQFTPRAEAAWYESQTGPRPEPGPDPGVPPKLPDALADALAASLCDGLASDETDSRVETWLRATYLMEPRPVSKLLGLRRRA